MFEQEWDGVSVDRADEDVPSIWGLIEIILVGCTGSLTMSLLFASSLLRSKLSLNELDKTDMSSFFVEFTCACSFSFGLDISASILSGRSQSNMAG